mgnify:CR=1 FL=1
MPPDAKFPPVIAAIAGAIANRMIGQGVAALLVALAMLSAAAALLWRVKLLPDPVADDASPPILAGRMLANQFGEQVIQRQQLGFWRIAAINVRRETLDDVRPRQELGHQIGTAAQAHDPLFKHRQRLWRQTRRSGNLLQLFQL